MNKYKAYYKGIHETFATNRKLLPFTINIMIHLCTIFANFKLYTSKAKLNILFYPNDFGIESKFTN